jgi:hypothetical protein
VGLLHQLHHGGERTGLLELASRKHAESPVRFVRVGTLDAPDCWPPDVHVHTASKQPWFVVPAGTPSFADFYNPGDLCPKESLRRRAEMLARLQQR